VGLLNGRYVSPGIDGGIPPGPGFRFRVTLPAAPTAEM